MPKLAAGASHSATIGFTIHSGADDVKRVAGRVATIQGETEPVLVPQHEVND